MKKTAVSWTAYFSTAAMPSPWMKVVLSWTCLMFWMRLRKASAY